ncbi:hypothetical protein BCV70DRAFT_26196 [Testicularia cyperi]|uniref:Uncharacterized protein n=1 Tax=Testicularia cyperi TaxID=1882483 RepID=A0A317XMZ8_9BASI|nr:hypothetical protein BCV70DRAFT_26196 [Testicularia cyperi]
MPRDARVLYTTCRVFGFGCHFGVLPLPLTLTLPPTFPTLSGSLVPTPAWRSVPGLHVLHLDDVIRHSSSRFFPRG